MTHGRRLGIAAAVAFCSLQTASACPVCFGAKDSPMNAGMNTAIWVMLGITGFVLSLIAAFFAMMWRRYRQRRKLSERTFVDSGGQLHTQDEQGVVEWNNI